MVKIKLTEAQLKQAGVQAGKDASEALSMLAKKKVTIKTTEAKTVAGGESKKVIAQIEEHMVIAYTQSLTGISGISLLAQTRPDALAMVDSFNDRPIGTTLVMKEIDRSAIKETLNILANAYVKQLANQIGFSILLGVPQMVTADRLEDVVKKAAVDKVASTIVFKSDMTVEGVDFSVHLMFFFLAQ